MLPKAWPSSELKALVPVLLKGDDLAPMHSRDWLISKLSTSATAHMYSRLLVVLHIMHDQSLVQVQPVGAFE